MSMNSGAIRLTQALDQAKRQYFRKGLMIAIMSGLTYGLYSGAVTLAMSVGIWKTDWFGPNLSGLSSFALIFVLPAIAAAVNDLISGGLMIVKCAGKGEFRDFLRVLKSKPALVMMICAIIGGPIASTCYIASIQLAGSIAVPFAALNSVIGAIIGKFAFKQKLTPLMGVGMGICVMCAAVIGGTSFDGFGSTTFVGILLALVCSLGWGIEGAVAGFGTSLIDYNIGITIRQCVSGLSNLLIAVPLLCLLDGNGLHPFAMVGDVFTDVSVLVFIVSGLFSGMSFGLWYKGASMCGAALAMTCNCAYAFWSPLFIWLVCGVFAGIAGYTMTPIQWIFAAIMIVGIAMVGNLNPVKAVRKRREQPVAE